MTDPWRAKQFGIGYSAEYLPCGQASWRILRERKADGKVAPRSFPTVRDAIRAAKDAYLRSVEPEIRASLPFDPERVKSKLEADAEQWLKSKREDVKAAHTLRKPGRKQVIVMRGRAR